MIAALPDWYETVRRRYMSNEACVFVLHGNVFDEILVDGKWMMIEDFVLSQLRENKDVLYSHDIGRGGVWHKGSPPSPAAGNREGSLEDADLVLQSKKKVAVLLPYAGSLVPPGDEHFLAAQDRANAVRIHQWSLSEDFQRNDNVVFLLCESLAEINARLVSNPRVAAIEVPLPDRDTRAAVIKACDASIPPDHVSRLADHTAGLRAVHIRQILGADDARPGDAERHDFITAILGGAGDATAKERVDKFTRMTRGMDKDEIRKLINPDYTPSNRADVFAEVIELIHQRKREIIEKECSGLIEFVSTKHGLDAVGGNEGIKTELASIAEALKGGDRVHSPMGLLFVGPMGTGKTFVAKAFAKSSGLSAVMLKNFRSKWVGSTEANLEKVLTMIKALGPIILMIDEGDRSFGAQSEDSDGGTSSRVIARLKEFMSDPDNRGMVLFVLMTNRPDKLDVDIKRAGRLDVKIPFFYEDTLDGMYTILQALGRRYGAPPPSKDVALVQELIGKSNADLEAVTLLALKYARAEGMAIADTHWARAIADFVPSRDETMLEYMELQAVFECSRRSMLPERFRSLDNKQLQEKLSAARSKLPRMAH